jgi:hypothetical protein
LMPQIFPGAKHLGEGLHFVERLPMGLRLVGDGAVLVQVTKAAKSSYPEGTELRVDFLA